MTPEPVETYGPYGGRYVPETLIPALDELAAAWAEAQADPAYGVELDHLGATYVGRPSPITLASRFAPDRKLYLKREDLNHTGAHKINNALGQVVLAGRLGKRRIIAETGAGQHGVATATACAKFGLDCVVYMGSEDMRRQAPNVERMELLGATVVPVEFGTRTLKEATSEAIRDWITNVETTHYVIGSCVGPAPYPEIVRELQSVIGTESRGQMLEVEGRLPDAVVACVGGGSNAIGMFAGFLDDPGVRLYGVEAAGAASLGQGHTGGAPRRPLLGAGRRRRPGHRRPLHLSRARLPRGRPRARPAPRPGRVEYLPCTDDEALAAFAQLTRTEGIIPALEPAHALAVVDRLDAELVLVCLSGRGDKDLAEVLSSCAHDQGPGDLPDGGPGDSELAEAAVEAGADIVEIGFPFSDPLADGPVIRAAGERALAAGMRTAACLEMLAETRARVGDTPLLPMTYASLLEAYGWERFDSEARAAGATGFILADVPAGVRPEFRRVQLVAPTSTDERIALAAPRPMAGSTWSPSPAPPAYAGAVAASPAGRPRAGAGGTSRSMPGSASPRRIRRPRRRLCDGVVVGSAAVTAAEEGVAALRSLVRSLRAAVDAAG